MKKISIYIFILTIIFIPINVFAIEITNTEITGTTEKNIGEEFVLDYKINLEGLDKDKTTGIWLLKYELVFDEETLLITDIISKNFNSYIYKENDKYYIMSEVIENNDEENICTNNILYCGNYQSTIKFYIRNTELTETNIKIKDLQVGLLNITDKTKTYTKDDLIKFTHKEELNHTIKINKTTNEIKEEPKSIITDELPTIKEEKKEQNKSGSSAFIKELKIKNHKINFEKNKTNYNITVEKNINELEIDVTLESELATYKIIGADDINANNNEIAIVVTSEDNNIITYTINVKYTDTLIEENKTVNKKIDIKTLIKKYLTKDNITYAAIGIGIIIIIVLLFILKNKRENKKINKLLREL